MCLFHLLRRVDPLAYEGGQTQLSETSAIKHHTPGNNPKDYMQH
jgi:hypothetical protein